MSINFSYNKSNYWKIIIAFLLGCITILLALGINKTTFRQMLSTVKQISQPDPKIKLVNNIFRKVVTLDQLQRQQALETNARLYNPFIKESQRIQRMLDTLGVMSDNDTTQLLRIDSMKKILYERDNLFLNYMYLRNKFDKNDTFNTQIKELSRLIAASSLNDSNLVKTEKKVTTTTIEHNDTTQDDNDKGSFWDRLFGKRKTRNPKQIERLIKEELKVNIDTTAIGKEDSVIRALDSIITYQENSRIKRRNVLVDRQTELNREGNKLISQLLTILRDIETEESMKLESKNVVASYIVDNDLRKMDAILVVFILCTAILVYFIIIDIARSNRYRKQLIAAKEEAEQLGQVKQRFLANMSHELRTPLQTIIGVAEQAKISNNNTTDRLEIIYQSSLHLLQIVNEVLDYSRIVSGKFQLEQKPFQMFQLLTDVVNTLKVQAEMKGLSFQYKFRIDEQAFYVGDDFRLKQILYNLLGNAIKFTKQGSVSLLVASRDYDSETTFTLSVKDTGIGIAADDLEKIFRQFEQVGMVNASTGTGLGLNIVKELVDAQNGTITVTSNLGSGSEFNVTLTFPKVIDTTEAISSKTDVVDFDGTVWVVDDDIFILQLCAAIFDKYHISYRCFNTASEALQASWDNTVKLVFLDIRMPEMNGMELCRRLHEKEGSTPVFIALTAQAMPDERQNILNNGFESILMKPFREKDFINAINQYTVSQIHIMEPVDFDIAALSLMSMGDKELEQKILTSFITETTEDLKQLNIFVKQGDYTDTANCLHRLASRCGQIGARKISLQLREMELSIRNAGRVNMNNNQFTSINADVEMLIAAVKQQLNK